MILSAVLLILLGFGVKIGLVNQQAGQFQTITGGREFFQMHLGVSQRQISATEINLMTQSHILHN